MSEAKRSISQARNYQEIGEFWDAEDLGDHWDQTEPADFDVHPQSGTVYFSVERELSVKLRQLAYARGVSAETLLNLWIL